MTITAFEGHSNIIMVTKYMDSIHVQEIFIDFDRYIQGRQFCFVFVLTRTLLEFVLIFMGTLSDSNQAFLDSYKLLVDHFETVFNFV